MKKAQKDKERKGCDNNNREPEDEMDVGQEEESEIHRNIASCIHTGENAKCEVDQMETEICEPKVLAAFCEEKTSCSSKTDCMGDKTQGQTPNCDKTKSDCEKCTGCQQQFNTDCDLHMGSDSDSESELESGELTESELSSPDSEESCIEISDQPVEVVEGKSHMAE